MPWKVTDMEQARAEFIEDWKAEKWPIAKLCQRHQISRKTGYKWIGRYDQEGKKGLVSRPPIPKRVPHAISKETEKILLEKRQAHPTWGPKLILSSLSKTTSEKLPSATTVHSLFTREGLVRKRTKRGRPKEYQSQEGYYGPNSTWCADYKGDMKTACGPIEPLTVSDGTSRFLLTAEVLKQNNHKCTQKAFERLFEQYGLPDAMRTDNGVPFSSVALAGLSELNIWFVKLGITPVLGRPGHPQDNGRHERLHRTMEEDCKQNLLRGNAPQLVLNQFSQTYNYERPHSSLSEMTPASVYIASTKLMPSRLRDPAYDNDMFVERVNSKGELWFMGQSFHLTPLLSRQLVGLRLQDDGNVNLRFGPIFLGQIASVLQPASGPRTRRRFIPVT